MCVGITPFVDPEDLKHFFEECHRVGKEIYADKESESE